MSFTEDLLGRPPVMRPLSHQVDDYRPFQRIDRGDGTVSVLVATSGASQNDGHRKPITMPAIPLTESASGR